MLDLLATRVLPALVFGLATSGLLWLIGLARKRAALTLALTLAAVFLAGSWPATLLVTAQVALVAVAAKLLHTRARLRSRDAMALTSVAALIAWGRLLGTVPVYWDAALVGALAGAATAWTGAAASEHWTGARVRLLTLRKAGRGGMNGTGITVGLAAGIVVAACGVALDHLGPGEPALAVVGGLLGTAVADTVFRRRTGLVLTASLVGGAVAAALVAYLP